MYILSVKENKIISDRVSYDYFKLDNYFLKGADWLFLLKSDDEKKANLILKKLWQIFIN